MVLRAVYLRLGTRRPFVQDRYVRLNPKILRMENLDEMIWKMP